LWQYPSSFEPDLWAGRSAKLLADQIMWLLWAGASSPPILDIQLAPSSNIPYSHVKAQVAFRQNPRTMQTALPFCQLGSVNAKLDKGNDVVVLTILACTHVHQLPDHSQIILRQVEFGQDHNS
jgi:hypothetical protein